MKNCSVHNCSLPSFGKDKKTGIPYCRNHQYLRTDLDKRSFLEKHFDKNKKKEVDTKEDLSGLIEDLDTIFSKYIRIKHANSDGIVECYTSEVPMRWQEAQCGHYISRGNMATRFLEANCRPQSQYDNCFLHGNIEVFASKLEEEHFGITEWLQEQARQITKFTSDELKGMIVDYRMKLKIVESKLTNN